MEFHFHHNEKLHRNDVATTTATTAANQTQNPLPESQLGKKKNRTSLLQPKEKEKQSINKQSIRLGVSEKNRLRIGCGPIRNGNRPIRP
ncbi:hypothetical protein LOK49_LG14G01103 [Camellia lanceoleosa]|uniref:Uncharacterized protein n=1 Tax=Camellia lanceoleosa TaxID=1840588 RepID=A0ACC0FGA3_9ERIC|nr:hypothetical protein LOK49_LG14G01103 [Camellia lanceoleosa]